MLSQADFHYSMHINLVEAPPEEARYIEIRFKNQKKKNNEGREEVFNNIKILYFLYYYQKPSFIKFKECSIIMSDKFGSGFNRAISEMAGGLIIPIFVSYLISTGLFPPDSIWILFIIISIVGMKSLIKEMSLWETSYSFGWLIGVIILAYSGLLEIIEFLIYLIPLVFLGLKFLIRIRH